MPPSMHHIYPTLKPSLVISQGATLLLLSTLAYAKQCVEPGLKYFHTKFTEELSGSVAAFRTARLFLPCKVDEMKLDASTVDNLQAFPFLISPQLLDGLKQELPFYMARAADVGMDIELLTWWKKHASDLPYWSSAACKVALHSPHLQLQSVFFHI